MGLRARRFRRDPSIIVMAHRKPRGAPTGDCRRMQRNEVQICRVGAACCFGSVGNIRVFESLLSAFTIKTCVALYSYLNIVINLLHDDIIYQSFQKHIFNS